MGLVAPAEDGFEDFFELAGGEGDGGGVGVFGEGLVVGPLVVFNPLFGVTGDADFELFELVPAKAPSSPPPL